jgi:hypothetical protein
MKRYLPVLAILGMMLVGQAALAADVANPWGNSDQAKALTETYLHRMGVTFETKQGNGYWRFGFDMKPKEVTYHMVLLVNPNTEVVFLSVNNYLSAPATHPALPKILQRLMEENWEGTFGHFEWDKTDGEVRYLHSFCTRDGFGYDTFKAVTDSMLDACDKLRPELTALTGQ